MRGEASGFGTMGIRLVLLPETEPVQGLAWHDNRCCTSMIPWTLPPISATMPAEAFSRIDSGGEGRSFGMTFAA